MGSRLVRVSLFRLIRVSERQNIILQLPSGQFPGYFIDYITVDSLIVLRQIREAVGCCIFLQAALAGTTKLISQDSFLMEKGPLQYLKFTFFFCFGRLNLAEKSCSNKLTFVSGDYFAAGKIWELRVEPKKVWEEICDFFPQKIAKHSKNIIL